MLTAIPDATEAQIRDELVTLLEAGHETTATGMAWLFEQLLRLLDVLAKVYGAIDGGDDAYVNAVVKESLQRRPVLLDAPRVLTAPLQVEGFEHFQRVADIDIVVGDGDGMQLRMIDLDTDEDHPGGGRGGARNGAQMEDRYVAEALARAHRRAQRQPIPRRN